MKQNILFAAVWTALVVTATGAPITAPRTSLVGRCIVPLHQSPHLTDRLAPAASASLSQRDGETEFDPDFAFKRRDGETEFDPDFAFKKRDGETEFDPDFAF